MIERERWNSENLMYPESVEYRYLGEIDELIKISDNINKTLRQISNNEYFSIQKEEVKDVSDFSMVKKNLIELENMINEL
jgi:hypothetical protein